MERTFSTMKRVKTYLRNRMGQDRLNGLADLSIHREIGTSTEKVIDVFAEKNRKIAL